MARADVKASLIDASSKGSLTVVKAAGDPFAQYGDPSRGGLPQPQQPLEGLVFNAYKIEGVDLTANQGWQELSKLSITDLVPSGKQHSRLSNPIAATTNSKGEAHFEDLEIGAYYIAEDANTAQDQGLNIISPFVATVPTTTDDGTSWNYDVTVHAKDQKLVGSKAISKQCIEEQEELQVGISGTLPAPDRDGEIKRYEIVDPLAQELTYGENSTEVFLTNAADDDRTQQLNSAEFTIDVSDGVARMSLTQSGLKKAAKLRDGNPEIIVTWRFNVRANATPEGGRVKNKGYLLPEGYPDFDTETTPGVPTNEVRIRIGDCVPTPSGTSSTITPPPNPSPEESGTQTPTPTTTAPEPSTPPGQDTPKVPVPVPGPGIPGHPEVYQPTPAQPSPAPNTSNSRSPLASTGANVIGVAGAGLALLVVGFVLARKTKREDEK